MTKSLAAKTKAEIIEYAIGLENRIEELSANEDLQYWKDYAKELEKASHIDYVEKYVFDLSLAIERGISFADLKELITGRIDLNAG